MALLLGWLLPFYRAARQGQPLRLGWPQLLLWLALAVVLAFNGPIVAATLAVLLLGVAGQGLWQRRAAGGALAESAAGASKWWSGQALGLLAAVGLLSGYSLYIGRNNAEGIHSFTLGELYQRLPQGIYNELSSKLGLPLLVLFVLLNAQLLRRYGQGTAEGRQVRQVLRWVGLFAVVFIALLPLGGYRPYRPYLLRNDSILPVLLGLLLAYGLSTVYLLRYLPAAARRWYLGGVLLLSGIFLNADRRLWLRENNACERQALAQLAQARTAVVALPTACPVMAWTPFRDAQESANNAELLYYWGITRQRTLYYNQPATAQGAGW